MKSGLKNFLDDQVERFNTPAFIPDDPVSIPHRFTDPDDISIAGLLTATIAWGQRPVILRNALRLMEIMGNEPKAFLLQASPGDFNFNNFCHRTFNGNDCTFFLTRLSEIYRDGQSLEDIFLPHEGETDYGAAIDRARTVFLKEDLKSHAARHFASPAGGSAAKRINMFLRWMVRKDNKGVDFGIWKRHDQTKLVCPLDIHSGNTARALKLLSRNANDWKAAMELTTALRKLDPADPVKYDFALFGLGVYEKYTG